MDKKVRVYTTPTCNFCQQVKEFLTEKGVAFETIDVSADRDALKEMQKVSGGVRSVPVTTVCDEVVLGFDRNALEQALKCLDSQ